MAESIKKTDYDAAKAAITTLINNINAKTGISWSWSTIGVESLVNPTVGSTIKAASINALNDGLESVWSAGTAAVSCPAHYSTQYSGQNASDLAHCASNLTNHHGGKHSYNSGYENGAHYKWCGSRKTNYNSVMNSGRSY